MNIKEKFLQLTSRTYPHGTEKELFPILFETVSGLQEDEFGNLFIKIGESDVMFTSHLDTATSANTPVNHVFDGNIIKTDGKSILGADDKAGVTVMLYMIKNSIPGLYYFFLGEEVGCVGSKKVAEVQKKEKIEGINKVISFDRRGTTSVITYQTGRRCASDAFGQALAGQLNKADDSFEYIIDPTGVLTDSVQFISIYPECTNISVGYQSEHTFSETQNINHLEKLAEACLKVDWNSLPVERDPSKTEYKSYGSYGGWGYPGWDDDDYYYGTRYGSRQSGFSTYNNNWGGITKPKTKTENIWFHDKKYNYVSKIEIEEWTKKVVSVDLCKERIAEEKKVIDSLMIALEIDFMTTEWDGFKYKAKFETYSTEVNRNDLIEYLPELDYSNVEELGETPNSMFDTDSYLDMCDGFYD
jgi:hypothetical protein